MSANKTLRAMLSAGVAGLLLAQTMALPVLAAEATAYPYLDTSLSFEERAADLVSRMTPEEKYSQLTARTAPAIPRLGVRAYDWWSEALHGVARDGTATSFPTGLGIAATWDTELVEKMATATSDEARDKFNSHENDHGLSYWSPTINMARDPRWGRAEETYGEDPYLSGMIASAFVTGMQGTDDTYLKAVATPKHFLANSSEQNRHNGSSELTERELREYYTKAFKYAVEDAGAQSIMTSYNAVNGVPMSVNEAILDGIVRRTWGFDGYVVTDCGALNDVAHNHTWRPEGWGDKAWGTTETAAYAIKAGVDLNCGSVLGSSTGNAVAAGLLTEDDVDKSLVRLFTARMKTGEFDPDGGVYGSIDNVIHSDANQALAEKSSDNAVVLLKNEENFLPLNGSEISNFVLVGDLADELILGDYSTNEPQHTSTAVEGIQAALERANPEAQFTYIPAVQGSSAQYMMNVRSPILVDAEGNELRTIDLNQAAEFNGCRLETNNNPVNVGYSNAGCWFRFDPGVIDFTDAAQMIIPMSGGDGNANPTQVEVRAMNPVTGPLLGTVTGDGDTDSWSNYEDHTIELNLGGGYTDQPIYFVLNEVSRSAEFTEEEQQTIKNADAVVVFAGTRPGENGFAEERDGQNLNLPNNQSAVINTVASLNENTVVYLQAVSQINIEPFKDDVKGIFWSTYNGQAQGNAAGRLLFGEANPSAKLPFTWYTDVEQLADIKDYQMSSDTTDGSEGNLGRTYQYFTGDVTYPFGYGLSYSAFEYSGLEISAGEVTPDDTITVEFDVTNTSDVDGQEVAEVYVVSPGADKVNRPAKRLAGFDKQSIPAGGKAHFSITLDVSDLWYWDEENNIQSYDQGTYTIQVGADSQQAEKMTAQFTLEGQLTPELHVATAIPSGHELDVATPGKTITTELSASYNDQSFADLSSADVTVTYTSSNPAVASVDADGVVTAVAGGIATITATVTENGVTVSDSYPVVVNETIAATGITVDGALLSGFDPDTTEYSVAVDSFDTLPVVEATAVAGATVTVEQASAENHTATVTVTKGEVSVVYTITFVRWMQNFDFTTATEEDLRSTWSIIRENADMWSLSENGLTISTEAGDTIDDTATAKNMFLQAAPGDWEVEAEITLDRVPNQSYQQVSMFVYEDDDNFLKVGYQGASGGAANVGLKYETNGVFSDNANASDKVDTTAIWLRIKKVGDTYTGSYSTDGETFIELETRTLDLDNVNIVLTANNGTNYSTEPDSMDVTFRSFRVKNETAPVEKDLSVAVSGADMVKQDQRVPYTFSFSGEKENLGNVTVIFNIKGDQEGLFTGGAFEAAEGFSKYVLDEEELEDGSRRVKVVLAYGMDELTALEEAALTDELTDMFTYVIRSSAEQEGNIEVTVEQAIFTYAGDNDLYYADVTGATANTSVSAKDPYDIDEDGDFDQADITAAQAYYRAAEGDANWDEARKADVNRDGVVDLTDLVELATAWLEVLG
ncbi:MAG TPA: glycoside hydrolase family 3 C-terminal domain-containing protein [Candidatus Flavonifractor intestinipullorum]|uniref:Glycoside hydrolase family 3 C-terminal domain-containing protein n=1 Tax=Candidatus Flavonifractor intestinipullorum TaxID=2838587 RepID=A0A9D2S6T0_9FIRM|nr:glycoside hydrolase family 3 C-terminal domain-containing protein [Candidatus Flavonifractor intestinipullorum]